MPGGYGNPPNVAQVAGSPPLPPPKPPQRRGLGSAIAERRARRIADLPEVPAEASIARTPPWARAYAPSWILPRRRSAIHVYVFLPPAAAEVEREAHAALDASGNAARGSHAVRLRRALAVGEPIVVRADLPGFTFGEPEPEPWLPPWVRVVVSVDVPAGVEVGDHRPLVKIRSGGTGGDLLATFDLDLRVLARDPRKAQLRAALGASCLTLSLAAFTAMAQHAIPMVLGLPAGTALLAGGAGALALMRPRMETSPVRDRVADVLVVTAVPEEYQAVRAVDTGAVAGGAWEERPGPSGVDVAFRDFTTAAGVMRVAVVQALGMGAANAVSVAARLIGDHGARCLAMCGVCAGRRGEVALGDVIVADRLWQYDTGKHRADAGGVKDQGDVDMYRIQPPRWAQAAERFEVEAGAPWLEARPRTYEEQGDWILERALHGADPAGDPDQEAMCHDFKIVLPRLWKKGLLRDRTLALTDAGRARIEEVLLVNLGKLPESAPFRVRVGPIASGNKVIEDREIFPLLAGSVRKVLGVEMEAAAVGLLAHVQEVPFSIVMKAVMDHGDEDKSDNFKAFAARASAECLIAFLRKNLPLR